VKTGVSLPTIERLNPKLDADTLHAPEVDGTVSGRACLAAALAAVTIAIVLARPAAAPAAPPAVRAPAAILVEPATGDVVSSAGHAPADRSRRPPSS